MTIQVAIIDDIMANGISIAIRNKREIGGGYLLATEIKGGRIHWEFITDNDIREQRPPTLHLEEDVARALLDALMRHYQGSGDLRTTRADLLHERGRVDNLIGTVQYIASKLVDAESE